MAVARQLLVNVTTTNVWTQLLEGNGGSVYAVPASSHADTALLSALNLGANSATIEFAISTNATIADAERILPPIALASGHTFFEEGLRHIIQTLEGVWVRAVGTTPNVTFRVSIREYTP